MTDTRCDRCGDGIARAALAKTEPGGALADSAPGEPWEELAVTGWAAPHWRAWMRRNGGCDTACADGECVCDERTREVIMALLDEIDRLSPRAASLEKETP